MRSSRVRWDPGPGPGLQPLPRAALIIVDDPLSALNRGIGVIKGFLGDQVKRCRCLLALLPWGASLCTVPPPGSADPIDERACFRGWGLG